MRWRAVRRDDQFADLGVAYALHAAVLHERKQRDGNGHPETEAILGQHLGAHKTDLSVRFTGRQKDRFEALALAFSADGLPLLQGSATQMCYRVTTVYKPGDHDIILREVMSGDEMACSPLVFHKGAHGRFQRTWGAATGFLSRVEHDLV